MSSNRVRRVTKELADIQKDPSSQVSAQPEGGGSDITHIKGSFLGPQGTPYEGGVFKVDIHIPNEYPFRPPSMKFDTKVWHPNISSQTVCCHRQTGECIGRRAYIYSWVRVELTIKIHI